MSKKFFVFVNRLSDRIRILIRNQLVANELSIILAEWLSVCLRTKWLRVRIPFLQRQWGRGSGAMVLTFSAMVLCLGCIFLEIPSYVISSWYPTLSWPQHSQNLVGGSVVLSLKLHQRSCLLRARISLTSWQP